MPPLDVPGAIPRETNNWLANALILVEASAAPVADVIIMKSAINHLNGPLRDMNAQTIIGTVLAALARAELGASPEAQGRYIPAESPHSAFAAVGKVLRIAKADLMIVDAYAAATALSDFAIQAETEVSIRILTDAEKRKADLEPATARWRAQYSDKRPLTVGLAPTHALHDRLIIVDKQEVWSVGQSLNGIAKRSPTAILKVPAEAAAEKIAAYEAIWASAQQI